VFALCVVGAPVEQKSILYGGLALAVGTRSMDMHPGANVGFDVAAVIQHYLGLGGHLEYTWQSANLADTSFVDRYSLHYWDVAFVVRGYLPLVQGSVLFAEVDPGLFMSLTTITAADLTYRQWEPDLGISLGLGAKVAPVTMALRYKVAFAKQESIQWIAFTLGVNTN